MESENLDEENSYNPDVNKKKVETQGLMIDGEILPEILKNVDL